MISIEWQVQYFLWLQTSFDLHNIKIPRDVEIINCLSEGEFSVKFSKVYTNWILRSKSAGIEKDFNKKNKKNLFVLYDES